VDNQKVMHNSQLNGLNGIRFVNCVTAIATTAIKAPASIVISTSF
jgi:hypothetical protein